MRDRTKPRGSCRVPGCWPASAEKGGDEGAKQGFAASARIMHELEEAEIKGQLVLRDAPVPAWCRDQGYGRTDPNPAWGQATRT